MVKGIEAFPVDFHGQSTITTVRKIKIVRRGFGVDLKSGPNFCDGQPIIGDHP